MCIAGLLIVLLICRKFKRKVRRVPARFYASFAAQYLINHMRFNINYEQSKSRKVATVPLDATTLFQGCILGADTHADTSCVGRHAYIIAQVMGRSVEAVPFSPSLGSVQNLSIVHAAYAYDDQETGLTTILIIHNAIFVPDMDNVLLCPDQARENNVKIDLSPTHYNEDSPYAITWCRRRI